MLLVVRNISVWFYHLVLIKVTYTTQTEIISKPNKQDVSYTGLMNHENGKNAQFVGTTSTYHLKYYPLVIFYFFFVKEKKVFIPVFLHFSMVFDTISHES